MCVSAPEPARRAGERVDGDAAVDHLLDLPGDPFGEDYGMVTWAWAVDRVRPIAVEAYLVSPSDLNSAKHERCARHSP